MCFTADGMTPLDLAGMSNSKAAAGSDGAAELLLDYFTENFETLVAPVFPKPGQPKAKDGNKVANKGGKPPAVIRLFRQKCLNSD